MMFGFFSNPVHNAMVINRIKELNGPQLLG